MDLGRDLGLEAGQVWSIYRDGTITLSSAVCSEYFDNQALCTSSLCAPLFTFEYPRYIYDFGLKLRVRIPTI
jgi:hypothetical protein